MWSHSLRTTVLNLLRADEDLERQSYVAGLGDCHGNERLAQRLALVEYGAVEVDLETRRAIRGGAQKQVRRELLACCETSMSAERDPLRDLGDVGVNGGVGARDGPVRNREVGRDCRGAGDGVGERRRGSECSDNDRDGCV